MDSNYSTNTNCENTSHATPFYSLTPDRNMDLDGYERALDYAFNNEDIGNIALSGAYGSGKTSVINSYELRRKENGEPLRFLRISLSHFNATSSSKAQSPICKTGEPKGDTPSNVTSSNNSNAKTDNPDALIGILEGKILNQLLHQIPHKQIPLSRFKTKQERTKEEATLLTGIIMFFCVALPYILRFDSWSSFVLGMNFSVIRCILIPTTWRVCRLLVLFVLIVFFGWCLYQFFQNHKPQHFFKKVDISGLGGIELFDENSESCFDKYLNEVVYLFKHCDADAVIFEDLDRYEATLIFEKLREINTLINQEAERSLRAKDHPQFFSRIIQWVSSAFTRKKKTGSQQNTVEISTPPRKIRFIYLLRDDVFTNSDRCKFFDFIIPIVPYTDASNAGEKLQEQLKQVGFDHTLDARFLDRVSLYLTDMRLVNNIVNEYSIYRTRLKSSASNLDAPRQLAMVIYKNLYPEDFTLLQQGRGYLFSIINNKGECIKEAQKEIDNQISEINEQLSAADEELLHSLEELNAIYLSTAACFQSIGDDSVASTTSQVELIAKIIESPTYVRSTGRTSNLSSQITAMEKDPDYQRRKEAIETKTVERRRLLSTRKEALEKEKTALAIASMKELLSSPSCNEDTFWNVTPPPYESNTYYTSIQRSPWFALLKYMIRSGYIDEHYYSYISYFYPGSLNLSDRTFLMAITDRRKLDYYFKLDTPAGIVSRLEQQDYSRPEIRNFDLLAYLLESENTSEIATWFAALDKFSITDNTAFDFLIQFWKTGREKPKFINCISSICPHWVQSWSGRELFSSNEWHRFIVDVLCYTPSASLHIVNKDGWLSDAIVSCEDFLQIDTPKITILVDAFRVLDVEFLKVILRDEDYDLFDAIYQNSLYKLNLFMLKLIISRYWNLPPSGIEAQSYTILCSKPDEPITKRVMSSPEEYMNVILHESTCRFSDEVTAVISLLNNPAISSNSKTEYALRLDTKIPELSSVEDSALWSVLLKHKCILFSWENIILYFRTFCVTANSIPVELSEFINDCTEPYKWEKSHLIETMGDELFKRFIQILLHDTSLSPSRYGQAFKELGKFKEFNLERVSSERVRILIENKVLCMTKENYDQICEYHPALLCDFVALCGTSIFMRLVTGRKVEVAERELIELLRDERLKESHRLELLSAYQKPLSVTDMPYPPRIVEAIIKENFDTGDIGYLLKSFDQQSQDVQNAFVRKADDYLDEIVEQAIDNEIMPTKLFAYCMERLDQFQKRNLLPYLTDRNYYEVCEKSKNPTFPDTDISRKILQNLEDEKRISSWKTTEDGVLRAYAKRQ